MLQPMAKEKVGINQRRQRFWGSVQIPSHRASQKNDKGTNRVLLGALLGTLKSEDGDGRENVA